MDAAISGIAGIGHRVLGVSMIMLLLAINKNVKMNKKQGMVHLNVLGLVFMFINY
mgnify:CR=1